MFKIGDKVEHILSKTWLLVIEIDGDSIFCRTKDLEVVELFAWELTLVK